MALNFPALRVSLIVFNTIGVLCGLWLSIFGLLMLYQSTPIEELLSSKNNLLFHSCHLAIILGWVVILSNLYGIHGALKQSYPVMATSAFLLVVLVVFQLAMAMILFDRAENSKLSEVERFKAYFDSYSVRQESPTKLDRVQSEYRCCGKTSFRDWDAGRLPQSCCVEGTASNCRTFVDGCVRILEAYVRYVARTLGWCLLAVAVVEFATLLLASCLASGIKNQLY